MQIATQFSEGIEDIRNGSGTGIAVESTWASEVREVFLAFDQDGGMDHASKDVVLDFLEILGDDGRLAETWDETLLLWISSVGLRCSSGGSEQEFGIVATKRTISNIH